MIVIEFVEAVEVMLDAAIGWIMLGSAIVSLLLLFTVAVAAWAAKRVRKGLSARLPPELPSSDQNPAGPAERGPQPQWAHADKEAA